MADPGPVVPKLTLTRNRIMPAARKTLGADAITASFTFRHGAGASLAERLSSQAFQKQLLAAIIAAKAKGRIS
jgi:hypothetical protein